MHSTITQKSLLCFLSFVLCLSLLGITCLHTNSAFAITENTEAELTETQRKIEDSAAAYNEATDSLASLEKEIAENEEKIDTLKESIPQQQKKSAEATVALYKLQEDGFSLFNMILSVESLDEFINTIEYINRIQDSNLKEITRLTRMKTDLEDSWETLSERKKQAEGKAEAAKIALVEAQKLRQAAQLRAEEEAAAEAATKTAATAKENSATQTPASGGSSSPSTPNPVDWSDDKATFVKEWGVRIDAYLAGSPTAGCGRIYAEAAWNYGIDPRYSPAISNTESSKGANCFRPYNAWGWMSSTNWNSWEEAINAHVRGLSRGYSYTICIEDAKKYCAGWEHWYNATLNQMNMI